MRVIEKWFAVKVKGYAAAGCVRRFDDERLDFCSEFAVKARKLKRKDTLSVGLSRGFAMIVTQNRS